MVYEFSGAQLLCPVCSSVVEVTDAAQSTFECGTCRQTWEMPLDQETLKRLAEFGI